MEVILREHVDNLGRRGEIVKVADGYARNYLLPRKLALLVDRRQQAADRARAREVRRARGSEEKKVAEAMAARLADVEVVIARKVGETEALYGSVTSADIADALAAQGLRDRSPEAAAAPSRSRSSATIDVPLKLHRDVTAHGQSEGRRRRRRHKLDARGCKAQTVGRSTKCHASLRAVLPLHFSLLLHSRPPSLHSTMPELAVAERTLPHNLEAERSVLGAILLHNDAFNLAAEVIDSQRFLPRRAPPHLRQDGQARRARRRHRSGHAQGRARARRASSTRSAARPTSPRSSTACRARPTSSTTRASSRRRRPSGT